MIIQRSIEQEVLDRLQNYTKAIIVYGARQVGKTTLCRQVLDRLSLKTLAINADERRYVDVLASRDSRVLAELVAGYEVLFIDEAQRVPDIGLALKILIDSVPGIRLLVTGSSALELANSVSEPLTGRTWTYTLYPIAQLELAGFWNEFERRERLPDHLRWGSYPELFSLPGEAAKTDYLRGLTNNYLYKDVLALGGVRNAERLHNLLKLLAFQIGSEVSLTELGTQLEMSKETVARYLDLLVKSFVLIRLSGFSRNLRKEVTKMHKYYFWDVGVRNAVIDALQPMALRNDQGQLWENWLVSERLKRNAYQKVVTTPHFWRTYTGAEVDFVEEAGGGLAGYEFKWQERRPGRPPASWQGTYPGATWDLITPKNAGQFVA
ncbi:MAG: AAA family ATPase [Candidatus Andersenbacteria bacterium CG10_big_fil_rev_8_21_14_0_10_54_11]|uniref:AAA family ATPase n=1 Tax=Candidatus Andersenbacteria bacterium CG10_big_fil_rev_8_21_14_0_10_54_11 TaxID=1974485 RepID=A0A2M6WZF3_9BACT|nr:MAG: AAA family ATPase [Candidatus Andersenbacteria bacterium CG10_big_fil_rev_8_21_14_0_10_54_11]